MGELDRVQSHRVGYTIFGFSRMKLVSCIELRIRPFDSLELSRSVGLSLAIRYWVQTHRVDESYRVGYLIFAIQSHRVSGTELRNRIEVGI